MNKRHRPRAAEFIHPRAGVAAGDANRHVLLNLIRARQPISRADLARHTGLQRSTVSLITGKLIRQRWVKEGGPGASSQGRKPTLLHLNVDRARILGVDIRPTMTTIAIADPNGRVLAQELLPTDADPRVFLRALSRRLRDFIRSRPRLAIEGLGVTVPGRIDQARQRLVLAPNLGWRDVDLKTPLERATGVPVELENAANACALAEASFGTHRGARDLVVVTVSEGIGTGIICNGRLLRGASGLAGEFGHVSLDQSGPPCRCGKRGCWEVFASNSAAVAHYLEAERRGSTRQARKHPRGVTFDDLLLRVQAGDRRAAAALHRMGRYLGAGIAMLTTGLDPSLILVAGEVTRVWDRVGPVVERRAADGVAGALPRILPAGDGGAARIRGTVALVLQKHFGTTVVA